jgi:hypothetical protein
MVRPEENKNYGIIIEFVCIILSNVYIFENTNVILTTKELSDNHKIRIWFFFSDLPQFACKERKNQLSIRDNFFECSNNTTHLKIRIEIKLNNVIFFKSKCQMI